MRTCLRTGCNIEIDGVLYRADMHLIDGYLVFTRTVKPMQIDGYMTDVKIFNHGTEYPTYPEHDEIRYVQVPIETPEQDIELRLDFKADIYEWNPNHRRLIASIGVF